MKVILKCSYLVKEGKRLITRGHGNTTDVPAEEAERLIAAGLAEKPAPKAKPEVKVVDEGGDPKADAGEGGDPKADAGEGGDPKADAGEGGDPKADAGEGGDRS